MGLLPCPLPCQSNEDSGSSQYHPHSNRRHLHSDSSSSSSSSSFSSSSSLSSELSLPSVPSLTISSSQQPPSTATYRCISTLKGHSSAVFSLSLAGKHLYSGSSDSEIRSWSRDTPSSSNTVVVPSGFTTSAVKSIVFSADKLFTAHQDHKIRVWKIDNATPETKNCYYKCIATLPTLHDRVSRFFSAKNYVEVRRHKKSTWVHHVDAVSALAVSRDGSLLYSASWDRTFKVWRTSDFKCLESVWNAHDDAINAVALSNDGFVYTGSADRKIKVWKREGGMKKKHKLVDTLEKHKSAINALALSTDGEVLYSGACDRSIIVWEKDDSGGGGDGRHMVVAGALRGHTKAILCLVVVSDSVFSGSADKTVRIWRRGIGESNNYSCLAVLEGHRGPIKCLAGAVDSCSGSGDSNSASGTSYKVFSGSLDFDIKVWQVWVPFF